MLFDWLILQAISIEYLTSWSSLANSVHKKWQYLPPCEIEPIFVDEMIEFLLKRLFDYDKV